jgi:hypothetical protein
MWRRLAWLAPVLFLTGGIFSHVALLRERVAETIRLSGRAHDVFRSYLDMRTLVGTAGLDKPVFISLGPSEYKSRQLLSYFLEDRNVAADWSDDGYIFPSLPAGWQLLSPQDSRWWIQSSSGAEPLDSSTLHSGNFSFSRVPAFSFTRQEVHGGYGVETDASGWWLWTERSIRAKFRLHAQLPVSVELRGAFIVAGRPRRLSVTVSSHGSRVFAQDVDFSEGWQSYRSTPFTVDDETIVIEISASGEAVPIGATDNRRVSMLIKNLRLESAGTAAQ